MNPMQGDQMASQLAQFSSLEQLQQINTTSPDSRRRRARCSARFSRPRRSTRSAIRSSALGNQLQVGGANGRDAVCETTFGGAATKATLHIFNASGQEVGIAVARRQVSAGKQTFDLGR